MSRPVDRRGPSWPGPLTDVDDARLYVGVSVDGEPPWVVETDVRHVVAIVRCEGCQRVATVWVVDRGARGEGLLIVAEGQRVTDWDTDPPTAQTFRQWICPGGLLSVDCAAHGVVEVAGDDVIQAVRNVYRRADKREVLHAAPAGARREVAPAEGMTREELNKRLGWE